jgi:hypothetical protein
MGFVGWSVTWKAISAPVDLHRLGLEALPGLECADDAPERRLRGIAVGDADDQSAVERAGGLAADDDRRVADPAEHVTLEVETELPLHRGADDHPAEAIESAASSPARPTACRESPTRPHGACRTTSNPRRSACKPRDCKAPCGIGANHGNDAPRKKPCKRAGLRSAS